MNRQVFSKLKLLGGILLFLMGVQVSLRAQTTPQYYNGTAGTGSNAIPLGGAAYTTNKAHFLYGPGVFNSNGTTGSPAYQGNITTVYFRITNGTSTVTYSDFTISLGQNEGTSTSFANTTFSTFTPNFYQASYSLVNPPTSGWYGVTLTTPFLYDPSLTLVFELKASTSSGGSTTSNGMIQSSAGWRKYGTYAATSGSTGQTAVDFGFDLVPSGPCTAPPTAGTATVSNANPCFGQPIMLSLFGNSYGTGQTYQWQTATSTSGPWSSVGAAQSLPAMTGVTPASGVSYYRCMVTCGTSTDSSVIDTVTVPTPFPGGTYTINPSLPASSTNFQTIGAAVSAISCGIGGNIIFNLASGTTFNEQVTLPATIGATASQTVTFNGNGDTVKFAGTSTQPWTVGLDGADYITFNDLIVSSTGTSYGLTTHLWNGADNNSFNKCIFLVDINQTSSLFSPFSISGSATSSTTAGTSGSYNIVDSCTMVGGYYNTCITGNTSNSSNGNKVMNSLMTDFYLYGTYFTYQDSLEITNNIIERPTRTTLSTFYGIYLNTGCTNSIVQQNRVRNMCGSTPNYAATVYGIYVTAIATAGNDNMIYNNLVSNFNNNSTVYGFYLTGQYMKIYHNTLSIDNTNATAGTIRGIYATGTAGVDMMNNNVYITQGGTGAKHCMYFSNATGKTSNYNNLYIGSTAGTNYIGYFSANLATLANWQGANSNTWDQNSVSIDPQFAAPLAGIFSPTNALLDNLGTPIAAVTVDINGASRSATTPDIGAFEFSVSNCSGTPNAGIATGPTATLCSGTSFNLSTSGFTIAAGISVQWQSSPASAGTWTDITGATTFNYNMPSGVSTSTDFRAVVTCTNSFLTDTTNVVTVSIAPLFPAGTYTINPALPASSTNFQTLAAAISAIDCGIAGNIIFNLAPGTTFNEQVTLPETIGSDATKTITFNGNGDTVKFAGTSTQPWTIGLDGADYITFNDLVVVGTNTSNALAGHLWNNADYNSFNNCTFLVDLSATSSLVVPFSISGVPTSATGAGFTGQYNVLDSCTIVGGYYNTVLYGDVTNVANGNKVQNTTMKDFYLYGGYAYYQDSVEFTNNIIERPTRTTFSSFYGIYLTTGCTNGLVQQNRFRNMCGGSPNTATVVYALYITAAATVGNENKIYNNLVSNINSNGTIYAAYLTGQNMQFYHNTIAVDNTTATSSMVRAVYATGTVGIDIKNNIVSVTQGGTGLKHCMYFAGAGKTSNYNNLYMGSTTGTNNIGYYSADFSTLTAWQGANSNAWDQNSLSVDPMPLSPATGNFSPTNSMLDNFGTPLASVPTDINGAVRSAITPDMGAYEFNIPPCLGTPSTAGIANANVDSACVGGPVQLSLTGYPLQSGITIQWQESYGANIWNDIIGATTANYTASFAAAAKYRAYVSCNFGTPVYSNVDSVSQMAMWACYCSPFTGQALHTNNANYITNVAITGTSLNNPSTTVGAGGYTRYYPTTATTTDSLMQNVSYPLSVSLSSTSYTGIAWVDFDRNGTFDIGESIILTNGQGTIAVPLFATPGPTGMRIRVATNATTYTSIDACLNSTTGYETEDYVVTIVPNIACSGTPSTGGTASVDKDTLCVMGDVKLSLANYPTNMGIAINWQSSPAGANTFTDILGAITDTFTVLGLSTSTDFRMRVTCTNTGGGTTYSNTETVIVNNPQLAMTIPGSRCGTGEVALYAAAMNGGSVNWYDSLTGGSKVGTGNIFITPSISTTTPYYAAPTMGSGGGSKPELIYYKFDVPGTSVLNEATIPVSPTGTVQGTATIGGIGQFGTALLGSGTATSTNSVNANWPLNLSGPWTIGVWFSGVTNTLVNNYMFGGSGGSTFRALTGTGVVAGGGNLEIRGTGMTDVFLNNVFDAVGTPVMLHYVYDPSIPAIKGYVNGVLSTTVSQPNNLVLTGTDFTVGGQGGSTGLNSGGKMDEFRLYNRALSAAEIAATWNTSLGGCEGARTQVSATINPAGTGNVSPGGTVVVNSQSSATTQSYGTCNDTVAVVNSGTTNLGITSAVTVTPLTVQTFGAQPYVPRAYDINPTTNGPATVTLYVLQSEFTAYNSYLTSTSSSLPMLPTGPSDATGMSHVVITQYHGAASAGTQGPLGLYSNSNIEFIPNSAITVTPVGSTYWKLTFPVSGFSGFFIHSGATPLDIKLASIAAANFGNRNRIDWTTADESNASYFELESSVDAKAFTTLGRTNAKGKASSYSYWDEQPAKGMNYYRLKVHMNNGSYTYSDVVRAFVAGGSAIMVEAYPNPTNDVLQVKVNGVQGDDAHILITDIAGKVLRRIPMESATTTISMSGMANGLYLLKYIDNNHQQTLRVTKQ